MRKAKTQRFRIENKRGFELAVELDLPADSEPRSFGIFAHCFTCTKKYKAPVYLGRELGALGHALLRFDFPGLGDSGGDFSETTLSANVEDIVAVAEFLDREYNAPSFLIGHSMGGAAALMAADRLDSIDLVTTLASPARPGHLGRRLREAREQARSRGIGELTINGRTYQLREDFFQDLERRELQGILAEKEFKLLVAHAPEDRVVSFENAEQLMEWASPPRELLKLEGGDHLLTDEEIVAQVARAIDARL